MTKDKAIKWLKVELSYIEENVGHGREILEAYDMAIEALEAQRWHKTADEVPESDVPVLCTVQELCDYPDIGEFQVPSTFMCQGSYCSRKHFRKWFIKIKPDTAIGNDNVIAWMPLPEPYVPDTNVGEMSGSEVEE